MPFNRQLQHLTTLARNPGFKAYAWHRAVELESESNLFSGLSEALKIAIDGPAKVTVSAHPSATKPRSAGAKSGSQ